MPNDASNPQRFDDTEGGIAPEVDQGTKARAMWSGFLVESGDELHKWLPVDETGFLRVAGRSHYDARAYYLYSVADELMGKRPLRQ